VGRVPKWERPSAAGDFVIQFRALARIWLEFPLCLSPAIFPR